MKYLIILTLYTVAVVNAASAQCSNTSQPIQSPVAPKPSAASATVSCTNMLIKWQGNADQGYELKITAKDAAGKIISSGINTSYTRSGGNNYTATIPVTPGTKVSWSLQGISTIEDRTFYSYPLRGKEYVIPACTAPVATSAAKAQPLQVISNKMTAGVKIYPNPVNSILHVEFNSAGATQKIVSLFNASGQTVQMKQTTENMAEIDVRQLSSGTYFIRINDANGKVLFNGKVIKE